MYLGRSNYIDVREHGAKLDGTTDDTDAFISAVTAANLGDGRVFIPPVSVNYYDGGGLTITPVELNVRRLTIFGGNQGGFNSGLESKTSCIKLKSGSSGSLITFTGDGGTSAQNIRMTGLKLDGNKAACSGTSHGIYLPTVAAGEDSFVEIDHCFIADFVTDCINSEFGRRATKVVDTKLWGSRNGWYCASSDGWLDKCDVGSMSDDGISIHDWTMSVTGNNIFSCRNGINLFTGEAAITSIVGNRIDRHLVAGIRAHGKGAAIVGNVFHKNSQTSQFYAPHIDVNNELITIQGNVFRSNGSSGGPLASYDIYIAGDNQVVISGNATEGRGFSCGYGHIGRSGDSRVILSSGEYDPGPTAYVSKTMDSASATTYTVVATTFRNQVIRRTGTPAGAVTDTTDTATNIIGDLGLGYSILNNTIGSSLRFRYINTTGQTITLDGGTGVTMSGTKTIATNTWRDFMFSVNSGTTATITNLGSGNL